MASKGSTQTTSKRHSIALLTVGFFSSELIEVRVIFHDDNTGFVKFKQRLIESLLAKSTRFLYPEPSKQYSTILDYLIELNEIHVEGRKSRLVIMCFKAQYLARTRNQFRAESMVDDIEKQLGKKDDKYLNILLKVTRGIIKIHQNHFESAISNFTLAIARLHWLLGESDMKPRYKILNLAAHYWTAEAFYWKKHYDEATRYSTALEEKVHLLTGMDNPEVDIFKHKNEWLKEKIDEKCCRKYDIHKVIRQPLIEQSIGLKLANVEGYRFYNPEAPVKRLDEFWPENDKQCKQIRALGQSIHHTKYSPYNLSKKQPSPAMDFRYHPASRDLEKSGSKKRNGREDDIDCTRPSAIDGHKRDHLVVLGRLTSDLRDINRSLDDY